MPESMVAEAIRSGQKTLQKYGLGTFIAICSVAFLMYLITVELRGARDDIKAATVEQQRAIQVLKDDIRDHMWQTSFYMRQVCLNTAVQSGANPQGCDMPQLAR